MSLDAAPEPTVVDLKGRLETIQSAWILARTPEKRAKLNEDFKQLAEEIRQRYGEEGKGGRRRRGRQKHAAPAPSDLVFREMPQSWGPRLSTALNPRAAAQLFLEAGPSIPFLILLGSSRTAESSALGSVSMRPPPLPDAPKSRQSEPRPFRGRTVSTAGP
jgi:hypothetical protein